MCPRRRSLAIALVVWTLPLCGPTRAGDEGWRFAGAVGARLGPAALATSGELAYRRGLYASGRPALALNHAQAAVGLQVSPASVTPSLSLEVQPLSVLALGIAYEPVLYLGTSRLAQSYPSPRARLGGGALRPVEEGPGGAYALAVHQLLLRGTLQGRVGRLAARAAAELARVQAALHGQDRVLYDSARDLLVYRRGWVLQGDLDLVWLASDRLVLGGRTTLATAWYPPDAFAGGDRGGLRERTTLRAGPLVRCTVFRGRGGLLDEGSLVAAAQWWLSHPDRAGRSSPQAVPLALLAFQVSGRP